MKIGIIGTGNIGASIILKLSGAGHDVKVANSRGPETIDPRLLVNGAQAVTAAEATQDIDALVLSVPMGAMHRIQPLLENLKDSVAVLDTSNYYPQREGEGFIPEGTVEAEWVQQTLARPIVKAWNAIGSGSLAEFGTEPGTPDRIAIPITGDRDEDKQIARQLVSETGFDAYDAGSLAESWRIQPGNPAYCTDLTLSQMPDALARADAEHAPVRRDIVVSAIADRFGADGTYPTAEWSSQLSRVIFYL
ncbi:NADPH-dependent F420 reductase [Rothia terrae]|uniref:NADPH-dependent F420 reductase n=1 Tax=Rothia terrae TaxID=396015 RepID=UPI0028822EC6|nr:NAD(P)-binding domain-containing protein [Rothia terrae]MDT0188743.1 NAD(P)-binding domain-containing protein [Rothia terrae]